MLRLSRAGATIMPACPGFYNRPGSVMDLVDSVTARVLDHLRIEHELVKPWGEEGDSLSHV
jgi:4-hydroxy-3-polyprenylbenzoate decarboxylase